MNKIISIRADKDKYARHKIICTTRGVSIGKDFEAHMDETAQAFSPNEFFEHGIYGKNDRLKGKEEECEE